MLPRLGVVAALCKTCSASREPRESRLYTLVDVSIHFPGSRQYGSAGEMTNAAELKDENPADIVKVIGTKEAIAQATEALQTVSERVPRPQGQDDFASRSISIPSKYYHALAEQPNLVRQIRNAGGVITIPKPAPAKPSAVEPAAQAARIDHDGDDQAEQGNWEIVENHRGSDEPISWVVRGKEQDLDKIAGVLEDALAKVKSATHGKSWTCWVDAHDLVGLLTGLPRSAFPRIIGSKGATITRLRADTNADIQVGRDDDLIRIIGGTSTSCVSCADLFRCRIDQSSQAGNLGYCREWNQILIALRLSNLKMHFVFMSRLYYYALYTSGNYTYRGSIDGPPSECVQSRHGSGRYVLLPGSGTDWLKSDPLAHVGQ